MKFQIIHESNCRARLRALQSVMSLKQADILENWLLSIKGVNQVTIHERTRGIIILFHCERKYLYSKLAEFSYETAESQVRITGSSRELNRG